MSFEGGHRIQMRWQDIDGLGHVNHAVVLTYLEEGRDRFLAQHGIGRDDYVVGSCTLRFRGEIDAGQDAVTVECELDQLGTASISTSERIVSDAGDIVVEAEFGIVLWDRERRGSRPLSAEERASLQGVAPGPAEEAGI